MADFTQSAKHSFLTHQGLVHPGMLEGTPYACAGNISGQIVVKIASIEAIANATGAAVVIQGSIDDTGDDTWVELIRFVGSTTLPETEALTATEPVGETVIAVASTTNLVVGGIIYIRDGTVVADGEWHRITNVVTNTSIDIDYGLEVAKDSADTIYTESNVWLATIDCSGLKRINVLVVHRAATGSDLHVLAEGLFATAFE